MDINAYRHQLIAPITQDKAVGERLVDEPLLDYIESQMVKVGSLSHTEVQWPEVEQRAVKLLTQKSKDLKVFTYLLQCLHYQPSPERFILSFYVLADFINHYWETCYPAPGSRGNLPRRKFYSQIIQRADIAAQKMALSLFDLEQKERLNNAIEEVKQASAKQGLPTEGLDQLASSLKRKMSNEQPHQSVATQQSSGAHETVSTTASTAAMSSGFSSSSRLDIDGSSDRAVRQTLLRVVDFLMDLDSGQLNGLRLRRFAIWFTITSLPEATVNHETQLMPVSSERIAEYEDQLKRGADLALWRSVEQSLTVAPYWLDGHYLSYRIAMKLNRIAWAEAIHQEIANFVARLPDVITLHFKGGIPFAQSETQQWILSSAKGGSSSVSQHHNRWDDVKKEAFSLAEKGELNIALAMLNEELKGAQEPRDIFYWRLLSADVLQKSKLSALAQQQYAILLSEIKTATLVHWEPSLIQRLERIVDTN